MRCKNCQFSTGYDTHTCLMDIDLLNPNNYLDFMDDNPGCKYSQFWLEKQFQSYYAKCDDSTKKMLDEHFDTSITTPNPNCKNYKLKR